MRALSLVMVVLTSAIGMMMLMCAMAGPSRGLGFTQQNLEGLLYDSIPGFRLLGGGVRLDVGADKPKGRVYSEVGQSWESEDGLRRLDIQCYVYDSVASAKERFAEVVHPQASSGLVIHGTLSGDKVGDDCRSNDDGSVIYFIVGRVIVRISIIPWREGRGKVTPLDTAVNVVVEALAYGLEYAIRQRPELLAKVDATERHQLLIKDKPVQSDLPVLTFHNITWSPLSAFKVLGAEVKEAKTNVVMVTYQGRTWVKVKAFSWEMETEKGKVKLERPVFPYKGELIVPLRQVAEALGIKVHQKGQTIALLPN